jgi:hypothetical protein
MLDEPKSPDRQPVLLAASDVRRAADGLRAPGALGKAEAGKLAECIKAFDSTAEELSNDFEVTDQAAQEFHERPSNEAYLDVARQRVIVTASVVNMLNSLDELRKFIDDYKTQRGASNPAIAPLEEAVSGAWTLLSEGWERLRAGSKFVSPGKSPPGSVDSDNSPSPGPSSRLEQPRPQRRDDRTVVDAQKPLASQAMNPRRSDRGRRQGAAAHAEAMPNELKFAELKSVLATTAPIVAAAALYAEALGALPAGGELGKRIGAHADASRAVSRAVLDTEAAVQKFIARPHDEEYSTVVRTRANANDSVGIMWNTLKDLRTFIEAQWGSDPPPAAVKRLQDAVAGARTAMNELGRQWRLNPINEEAILKAFAADQANRKLVGRAVEPTRSRESRAGKNFRPPKESPLRRPLPQTRTDSSRTAYSPQPQHSDPHQWTSPTDPGLPQRSPSPPERRR